MIDFYVANRPLFAAAMKFYQERHTSFEPNPERLGNKKYATLEQNQICLAVLPKSHLAEILSSRRYWIVELLLNGHLAL